MTAQTPGHAGLTCPRCNAQASPQPEPQTCGGCNGSFTLHAGLAGGAAVTLPAPDASWKTLLVKSPGVFVMRFGSLDQQGIAEGILDPVIGLVPVGSSGVAYPDVISIAVWRSIAWLDLVTALLIPVPLAVFFFSLVPRAPAALYGALPFTFIAAVLLHRGVVTRACRARVIGLHRAVTVRFDRPFWRRRAFHSEMFRRCGIAPPALP
jgi:hypothetical protein